MQDFRAFHGTDRRALDAAALADYFKPLADAPQGLHLGTLAQARMRAGRNAVIEVRVLASRLSRPPRRVREAVTDWRPTIAAARRARRPLLVYLNRYEGLPAAAVARLSADQLQRLDGLPDAEARWLIPEASDSWIVLDPALVEPIRVLPPASAV